MSDGGFPCCDGATLAAAIYTGSPAAEAELVRRLARPLRLMLRQRRVPPDVQDDLLQDALVVVLKRLRSAPLDDATRLEAFVEGVVGRLWLGGWRRDSRRERLQDHLQAVAEPLPELPPDRQFERERIRSAVQAVIAQLHLPRDRQLIRDYYLHELDKLQICARLNVGSVHFDRILYNARRRLRALLIAEGLEEDHHGPG